MRVTGTKRAFIRVEAQKVEGPRRECPAESEQVKLNGMAEDHALRMKIIVQEFYSESECSHPADLLEWMCKKVLRTRSNVWMSQKIILTSFPYTRKTKAKQTSIKPCFIEPQQTVEKICQTAVKQVEAGRSLGSWEGPDHQQLTDSCQMCRRPEVS
jgi:hypothetical protein